MQVRGKSLIFSGHFKASKLFASFLERKNLGRRWSSVLLISNQLCKQRSSLTLFKDIGLIEMIFWDCNFLMPPLTISIKPIKVVLSLLMILTTKIIQIQVQITSPKVVPIMAKLVSLALLQNLVHQALIIRAVHLVKTIKIVLVNHFILRIHKCNAHLHNLAQIFWLILNNAMFCSL